MAFLAAHAAGRYLSRLAIPILLSLLKTAVSGQTKVPDYQIEAVYLFNFTQFVEWPATAFADAHTPMTICVLGDDPFGAYLDETVRGETVGDRTLTVRRYHRAEGVEDCQVLFISRSETEHMQSIIDHLQKHSVLTVSDADGFDRRGGIVRFVTQTDHVRLRINLDVAKAAGLTISSKLLRVAETVTSEKD